MEVEMITSVTKRGQTIVTAAIRKQYDKMGISLCGWMMARL